MAGRVEASTRARSFTVCVYKYKCGSMLYINMLIYIHIGVHNIINVYITCVLAGFD